MCYKIPVIYRTEAQVFVEDVTWPSAETGWLTTGRWISSTSALCNRRIVRISVSSLRFPTDSFFFFAAYLKIQSTAITDMIVLPDVQVVCTSSIECDLRFYDTAAKKFDLRILVVNFFGSCKSIDSVGNQPRIVFLDIQFGERGCLHALSLQREREGKFLYRSRWYEWIRHNSDLQSYGQRTFQAQHYSRRDNSSLHRH